MELALLRTLMSREFYNGNKNIAKERIFRSKELVASSMFWMRLCQTMRMTLGLQM